MTWAWWMENWVYVLDAIILIGVLCLLAWAGMRGGPDSGGMPR